MTDGDAGTTDGQVDTAVLRFIERFTLDMVNTGVPRMPARVLSGLLTMRDGAATAGELSELLQVSAASISNAVRYLAQINMITRRREPGSRSDHYQLMDDAWYEVMSRRDHALGRWQDTMAEGLRVLDAGSPAHERLAEMYAFIAFMRDELPAILERWRGQREQRREAVLRSLPDLTAR